MIELVKILCLLAFFAISLPVIVVAALACAIYEVLLALWYGWQWLKEVGK